MASLKATHLFLAFNPQISWPLPCVLLIPALFNSLSHQPPLKCCCFIWQTTTSLCACASVEVIPTPRVKSELGPSRAHAASRDRPYLGRQPFPLPACALQAPPPGPRPGVDTAEPPTSSDPSQTCELHRDLSCSKPASAEHQWKVDLLKNCT